MRFFVTYFISFPLLWICAGCFAFAENVEIKYHNITLKGHLVLADERTISDGVVLMVHDTFETFSSSIMERTQEILMENGYNSLAITLSLSRDNRIQDFECYEPHYHKHTDALFEIEAWVQYLQKLGVPAITFLGHGRAETK